MTPVTSSRRPQRLPRNPLRPRREFAFFARRIRKSAQHRRARRRIELDTRRRSALPRDDPQALQRQVAARSCGAGAFVLSPRGPLARRQPAPARRQIGDGRSAMSTSAGRSRLRRPATGCRDARADHPARARARPHLRGSRPGSAPRTGRRPDQRARDPRLSQTGARSVVAGKSWSSKLQRPSGRSAAMLAAAQWSRQRRTRSSRNCIRSGRISDPHRRLTAGVDRTGQLLAQLDAPLVERVDVPDHALHEHLVLVQRDQPAERARRQARKQRSGCSAGCRDATLCGASRRQLRLRQPLAASSRAHLLERSGRTQTPPPARSSWRARDSAAAGSGSRRSPARGSRARPRAVPWCSSWKNECCALLPGSPQITARRSRTRPAARRA